MRGGRSLCIRFFCENMHKTDYFEAWAEPPQKQ